MNKPILIKYIKRVKEGNVFSRSQKKEKKRLKIKERKIKSKMIFMNYNYTFYTCFRLYDVWMPKGERGRSKKTQNEDFAKV